jgi:short-subunit dehydrogenase
MTPYTLITGASSGLGLAFAHAYAAQRHALILIARRAERLEQLKSDLINAYGVDVIVVVLDLSDRVALEAWLDQEAPKYRISRLINNAGFGYAGEFEAMPIKTLEAMQEVNMSALTRLSYALIPSMKAHGAGEILNVASVAGFVAGPYMALYYATKAYVVSLSEALHIELQNSPIKVSALCPGPTHTEFFHVARNELSPLKDRFTMPIEPVIQAGMRGLEKNQAIVVPGWSNHLLVFLLKMFPRGFAARAVMRFQSPKRSTTSGA